MNLLKSYLSREILYSTLLVALGLLAMFSFFDLIQELDDMGKGNYNLGAVLFYVLLSAPGHIYEVTPVAVLLGTTYALAQLSHHSELVVMRTSGLSVFSIGMALARVGLAFVLITFIVGELIAPVSEKTAQKMRLQATEKVVAQEFRSGLWVKDGSSFVNIEEVLPDTSLKNIHIYEFDSDFKLRTVSNASGGIFEDNLWKLRGITQTQFFDNKIQTTRFEQARWKSVIQPELLNVLLVVPEKMAAWNLYSYINHLSENRQKTTRHEIALWSKLFYPMACLVMIIIALPIGFLHQRSSGIGKKVLTGIMIGLGYQVVNRVFMHMGLLNDWPPIASATGPTLLFLAGGIWMLSQMEKR